MITSFGFKDFAIADKEDDMLEYDFFYGARRNIYLTFDYPREVEGGLQVPVRFQRLRPGRDLDDIAETVAPACLEWDVRGFADDEMAELKAFLADNMRAVMDAAASVLGDDEDLVVMEFDLDRDTALMVERAAYSEGVSPAEFIRSAVRYMIERVESGDESFIAMLREEE